MGHVSKQESVIICITDYLRTLLSLEENNFQAICGMSLELTTYQRNKYCTFNLEYSNIINICALLQNTLKHFIKIIRIIFNTLKCMRYKALTLIKYGNTLILVGFRTHQTLYSAHFDKKKSVSGLALAWDASHLLELVWVMTPPLKRKCFIVWY